MLSPLTFSAIAPMAFINGIKFLYGQVCEILKRWQERKNAAKITEI